MPRPSRERVGRESHSPEAARADRVAAIREALAGVALGAHDARMIKWLAGWDIPTVGSLVSLLDRVRAAGEAGR